MEKDLTINLKLNVTLATDSPEVVIPLTQEQREKIKYNLDPHSGRITILPNKPEVNLYEEAFEKICRSLVSALNITKDTSPHAARILEELVDKAEELAKRIGEASR